MTRLALFAGVMAVGLGTASAEAQTQPFVTEQSQIKARTLQLSRQQVHEVDGRQLIAALDACQGVSPQSRKDLCEKQARRTGGTGVLPNFSATSAVDARDDNQYERHHP